MTTLDHPDLILSDRREHIMQAVRDVITADHAAERRRAEQAANAAIEEWADRIATFLEDYGTDSGLGMVSGPSTDPTHALAWVTTAAGFSFEIVESRYPDAAAMGGTECWLLHPMTGERVYRIDYQATWANAARAIHAADERTVDIGDPEPDADHPADVLVDALRAFVAAVTEHNATGGF